MGLIDKKTKAAIRRGAWCNDSSIPAHLQKHFRIQTRAPGGMWMNCYGDLNASQASIYWKGQCAHNGYRARLLERGKVIAEKGEL